MKEAIDTLVTEPFVESLMAARAAWLAANVPYQRPKVFRFCIKGWSVSAPSLADLVAQTDASPDAEVQSKLSNAVMALGQIKIAAQAGLAYDQMLETIPGEIPGDD